MDLGGLFQLLGGQLGGGGGGLRPDKGLLSLLGGGGDESRFGMDPNAPGLNQSILAQALLRGPVGGAGLNLGTFGIRL